MKLLFLAILAFSVNANAAVLCKSSNSLSPTHRAGLAVALTAPGCNEVAVTSALSSSFSNISTASVHQTATDRKLVVGAGGRLANTTTLRIAGPFEAGNDPVFVGTGAVQFLPGSVRDGINFKWFPRGSDDTIAFQKAAAAVIGMSGTVHVPTGIYYMSGTVTCQNGSSNAVRWEFEPGVIIYSRVTGLTPLFLYDGGTASVATPGAGIYGRPTIISTVAEPIPSQNAGVAVQVNGAIGLNFNFKAQNLSVGLLLNNKAAGSYTEQVHFNVWSQYCDIAILLSKDQGNNSFHGCGGRLYADIGAGQWGIFTGSGTYWYNFDLTLDAIGHSSGSDSPACLINSDGQVQNGIASIHVENQPGVGVGATNNLTMTGAQPWTAQTTVTGGTVSGSRAKHMGFNFPEYSAYGLNAFASAQQVYQLAADASIALQHAQGAIILIRNVTSSGAALILADEATNITVVSDPAGMIATSDPGSGGNKFYFNATASSNTATTLINRFGTAKTINVFTWGF